MFRTSMSKGGRDGPSASYCWYADMGRCPDGRRLPENVFYFHPNNSSVTAAHQDPSHFLASAILRHFSFLRHQSTETGRHCTSSFSYHHVSVEKMTQSHHLLYTCSERALRCLRIGPCKVIRLILWAKLQLLQSQNEKPHPQVSCLTVDGCHLTFPAAGYWFRHQSK